MRPINVNDLGNAVADRLSEDVGCTERLFRHLTAARKLLQAAETMSHTDAYEAIRLADRAQDMLDDWREDGAVADIRSHFEMREAARGVRETGQ